jgi:hypothetical protein
MWSRRTYRDASTAYRAHPADFRPVDVATLPATVRAEVEWLAPGEYLQSDGLVIECGDIAA